MRLLARDVVELLRAVAGEVELDDVALALRADVRSDRRQLEVLARRLGHRIPLVLRVELEEVVEDRRSRIRLLLADAARARLTADDGPLLRDGEDRRALRLLAVQLRRVEQLLDR